MYQQADDILPDTHVERLASLHVDMVYASAMRQLRGDASTAEDVTQGVMLVLLRKARENKLPGESIMAGWLLKVTAYVVLQNKRTAARRARHEAAAIPQSEIATALEDDIKANLDHAILALSTTDREVVIRRYLRGESLFDVARALGLNEKAAGKRANRAVDKLRKFLTSRGVYAPAATVFGVMCAQAVVKAPPACAAIPSLTPLAVTANSASLAKGALMAMTLTKIKIVAAVIILCLLAAPVAVVIVRSAQSPLATPPSPAQSPAAASAAPATAPDDFTTPYTLADNQVLKRVTNVPADVREAIIHENIDRRANASQVAHFFMGRNQNGLSPGATSTARRPDFSIDDLLHFTAFARGLPDVDVEIDPSIAARRLTGDVVFEQDASDDQYAAAVAAFLHNELAIDAPVAIRDVPRKVLVLRGTWNYTPLPDAPAHKPKEPCIELFDSETLDPTAISQGESTTGRNHLARNLGSALGVKVFIEADGVPATVSIRSFGENFPNRALILKHISEQTGLSCTEEIRTVRRLIVGNPSH